jgi:hypothetical protein
MLRQTLAAQYKEQIRIQIQKPLIVSFWNQASKSELFNRQGGVFIVDKGATKKLIKTT